MLDELELDRALVVPAQDEPLELLDRLDDRSAHLAVVPLERRLAARHRVQLDVVGEPLLEPLRLGQRLPGLLSPEEERSPARSARATS